MRTQRCHIEMLFFGGVGSWFQALPEDSELSSLPCKEDVDKVAPSVIGKAGFGSRSQDRAKDSKGKQGQKGFSIALFSGFLRFLPLVSSSKEGMKCLPKQPRNYSPFSVGWGLHGLPTGELTK